MSTMTSTMQDNAKKRGDELIIEANACLNAYVLFGFGKSTKHRQAADKFKMAGNSFKIAQAWDHCGDAFLKAHENFNLTGDDALDALTCLEEAGQAYKKNKGDNNRALSVLRQAVDTYNLDGRFARGLKALESIAEIHESDENWEGAVETYEQIAQLALNDNKPSQANKWHLKMAGILSEKMEAYAHAGEIFKDVGNQSMKSNLGKYAAKGYYFQYLCCLIATGDCVAVEAGLESCKNTDYSFVSSREFEFIQRLNCACLELDNQEYAQACADFDAISPLDPWKTTMLLKGRSHIPDDESTTIVGNHALDEVVVGDDTYDDYDLM